MSEMKIREIRDFDLPGLGEKIKRARQAHPTSLVKLAAAAGINRSYWYDIEAERLRYPLPLETLRKIEEVLGDDFGVEGGAAREP